MFGRIRSEFQCFEGKDQNSKVWTDKVKIPMFGRIRAEFQCSKFVSKFECLEAERKNSNV